MRVLKVRTDCDLKKKKKKEREGNGDIHTGSEEAKTNKVKSKCVY